MGYIIQTITTSGVDIAEDKFLHKVILASKYKREGGTDGKKTADVPSLSIPITAWMHAQPRQIQMPFIK